MKSINNLKIMVNTYYDYQELSIRLQNRLKLKGDGSQQIVNEEYKMDGELYNLSKNLLEFNQKQQKDILKAIKKELKNFPIWNDFLKNVKGVGATMGAVIITTYDIHKATTVSKIWQYTGLNPGLIKGKKVVDLNKVKNNQEIIKRYKSKEGVEKAIVETDEMVKGDKLTTGFVSPYNKWLRAKMVGVLGAGFLKANSPYRKYYDDYKHRKESSNWGKSIGHRHNASIRKMVKYFLIDLYSAWRELEGLPVREPYKDEYIKKHGEF